MEHTNPSNDNAASYVVSPVAARRHRARKGRHRPRSVSRTVSAPLPSVKPDEYKKFLFLNSFLRNQPSGLDRKHVMNWDQLQLKDHPPGTAFVRRDMHNPRDSLVLCMRTCPRLVQLVAHSTDTCTGESIDTLKPSELHPDGCFVIQALDMHYLWKGSRVSGRHFELAKSFVESSSNHCGVSYQLYNQGGEESFFWELFNPEAEGYVRQSLLVSDFVQFEELKQISLQLGVKFLVDPHDTLFSVHRSDDEETDSVDDLHLQLSRMAIQSQSQDNVSSSFTTLPHSSSFHQRSRPMSPAFRSLTRLGSMPLDDDAYSDIPPLMKQLSSESLLLSSIEGEDAEISSFEDPTNPGSCNSSVVGLVQSLLKQSGRSQSLSPMDDDDFGSENNLHNSIEDYTSLSRKKGKRSSPTASFNSLASIDKNPNEDSTLPRRVFSEQGGLSYD